MKGMVGWKHRKDGNHAARHSCGENGKIGYLGILVRNALVVYVRVYAPCWYCYFLFNQSWEKNSGNIIDTVMFYNFIYQFSCLLCTSIVVHSRCHGSGCC